MSNLFGGQINQIRIRLINFKMAGARAAGVGHPGDTIHRLGATNINIMFALTGIPLRRVEQHLGPGRNFIFPWPKTTSLSPLHDCEKQSSTLYSYLSPFSLEFLFSESNTWHDLNSKEKTNLAAIQILKLLFRNVYFTSANLQPYQLGWTILRTLLINTYKRSKYFI